jgi:hypothetical protein
MTKEDIVKLARQVGYPLVEYDGTPYIPPLLAVLLESISDAEREECAKLAEQTICDKHIPTGVNIYGTRAAKAIRARGNT